ncbi:MAG TPA: diguanylate cyclase [Thermoanaerobaculia bacterium]|nr:diguanylate cyclase [Thermoanaerobaculia bacterium]
MSSPIRLRTRVLLMTGGFALALLAITFGLSTRAKMSQERWTRIVAVETEAVAALEEVIRAQNAFRKQVAFGDARAAEKYKTVEQLLDLPALRTPNNGVLRERVEAFSRRLRATDVRLRRVSRAAATQELDAASARVINEAQRLIEWHKQEITRQLPQLERETGLMMTTGLAIAWIVILLSFTAAKITISRVVRPLEQISAAAARIAGGVTNVSVPVTGDLEVVQLGRSLNAMANTLSDTARTDELTRLPNFRAFRERIDDEIHRSNRLGYEVGMLVLDLDRFKQYNDRFGHLAGNDVLQRVAAVIAEAVRRMDFPARYGGEEFAVVVPNVDVPLLSQIAERIRANVEALPAASGGGPVTVSIGAAVYPADGATAEALFEVADERLYRAKREGRNRVVVSSPRAAQSAG